MKPGDLRVEPIVYLLAALLLLFSGILIFCEYRFPMDGQVFQVFSGLLTSLAGAFLMRIKPRGTEPDGQTPSKTTTTIDNTGTLTQETQVGQAPVTVTPPKDS